MSRRWMLTGALCALTTAAACGGGQANCPQVKPPDTASKGAASAAASEDRLPIAERQKDATIMVQAALPKEIKSNFEKSSAKAMPGLGTLIGEASVEWTSRGSGFFAKAPNGKIYAVTNHHVVSGANGVTLKITKNLLLTNSPVVYTDDYHDIAIIALPDVPAGVMEAVHVSPLADKAPRNDEPVDASGFPAVVKDQSYRLTQGTISNAAFTFKIDGRDEPFIEHTATIDHGNSGGPLYRRESMEVLGINTLSFSTNKNFFCAVPAETIKKALENATHVADASNPEAAKKKINETCRELVQDLEMTGSKHPPHTLAIISDDIVAKRGMEIFVKKASDDEDLQMQFKQALMQVEVMNFLRPMVMDALGEKISNLGSGKCEESNINESDLKDYEGQRQVRQRVEFPNGAQTFAWRLEQGHWRLLNFSQ